MNSLNFRRNLFLISTLSFLGRVLYVFLIEKGDPLTGDAFYYHHAARLLADGLGFTEPYRYLYGGSQELLFINDPEIITTTANTNLPVGHIEPTAGHPPLWVLFLGIITFFGINSILGHQLFGALIGALGVVAIGWTGKEIGGGRTGLIAATIAASYTFLWINDGLIMSETLVIPLVALLTGFTFRFKNHPSWKTTVILGFLIGLATLTRAELGLFLPVSILLFLFSSDSTFGEKIKRCGAISLVALMVLSPWVIRNLTSFDNPVLLSNGSGILIAQTNCNETYYGDKQGYWEYLCGLPQPLDENGYPVDESVRDAEYRKRGLNYINQNFSRFITNAIPKRIGRLWSAYNPIEQLRADMLVEGRSFKLSVFGLIQFYSLLPFAFLGILQLSDLKKYRWPILIWPSIVTVIAALTMGTTRYRVPAEVALVICASISINRFTQTRQQPRLSR